MPGVPEYINDDDDNDHIASMAMKLVISDEKMLKELRISQATTPWDDGSQTDDTDPYPEDSDSDSDSDESNDDENYGYIFQPPFPPPPRLHSGSLLAPYQEEILEAATQHFLAQLNEEPMSGNDDEHVNTYLQRSLPCPFYVSNPSRHRPCLHHDLQRPIDVKRHLCTSHRQSQCYCPICRGAFATALACDAHIRRRECQKRREAVPMVEEEEGLSDAQIYQLAEMDCDDIQEEDGVKNDTTAPNYNQRQDRSQQNKQARRRTEWTSIWSIVFPREVPPSQPPQSDKTMRELATLREFWDTRGLQITVDFLAEKGVYDIAMSSRQGRRNLRALRALVLDRMVEDMLASLD